MNKQLTNFNELFERYLEETGPSVVWSKIKPPPKESVSVRNSFHKCKLASKLV